jgi:uncharacterized protein (UPF0303 family)
MGIQDDITRLKMQEDSLQFASFSEDDAWRLGCLMRERAVKKGLPLVIDIRAVGRHLFYVALPSTVPDNEDWVRRKINAVMRFQKSSYRIGLEHQLSGKPLDESRGIARIDCAAAGGCFPIRIRNAGVIGTVTVSGLPQREDHDFVVEALCHFLEVSPKDMMLASDRPQS